MEQNQLVENIVAIEWQMFQEVQNEGGRADCQDNYPTFKIMRSSQLAMWSESLCASYRRDLYQAKASGDNPLSYKYAYMMERTFPEEYEKIKDHLPKISEEKQALVDRIVEVQMAQVTELAENYPIFVKTIRPMYRSQDSAWGTSFETYLWGELKTYSEDTLKIYLEFLQEEKGQQLVERIMTETALAYGYSSLKDAEQAMMAAQAKNQ